MKKFFTSLFHVGLVVFAIFIVAGIGSVFTLTYIKMDTNGMLPQSLSIGADQVLPAKPPTLRGPHALPFQRKDKANEYEV